MPAAAAVVPLRNSRREGFMFVAHGCSCVGRVERGEPRQHRMAGRRWGSLLDPPYVMVKDYCFPVFDFW